MSLQLMVTQIKDAVISVLKDLPEDVDFGDILEVIHFQQKLTKIVERVNDAGGDTTHEKVKARIQDWIESGGLNSKTIRRFNYQP